MAYTEQDKTNLKKLLASGVKSTTYGPDVTTMVYRDYDEIKGIMGDVDEELDAAGASTRKVTRQIRICFQGGLT